MSPVRVQPGLQELVTDHVAIADILDQGPCRRAVDRAWVSRRAGVDRPGVLADLRGRMRAVGYVDVLAIENEDAGLTPAATVDRGATFHALGARDLTWPVALPGSGGQAGTGGGDPIVSRIRSGSDMTSRIRSA